MSEDIKLPTAEEIVAHAQSVRHRLAHGCYLRGWDVGTCGCAVGDRILAHYHDDAAKAIAAIDGTAWIYTLTGLPEDFAMGLDDGFEGVPTRGDDPTLYSLGHAVGRKVACLAGFGPSLRRLNAR
jgi:hypothetical protein